MNKIQLIAFQNADELVRIVAAAWLKEIAAANQADQPQCVALSGGRITLKFFAAVMAMSRVQKVSLANVHFFWADERCVAPDDQDSSFGAAYFPDVVMSDPATGTNVVVPPSVVVIP